MELADAVVVVTGASSGFGEATARRFAEAGARVVLAARRADRLDALAAEIERAGGSAVAVPCDVAEPVQIRALRDAVAARFGHCDVLVNNAGVPGGGRFEDLSEDQIERVILVNAIGVMRCTKAFLPMMLERGRGHIVNVASLAGRFAAPGASVYTASKHAVVAFGEALHHELAGRGVRVTTVNPAFARTDSFSGHGPAFLQVTPERVADTIVSAVRDGGPPEISVPRWVAPFQAVRVLTPRLYRWGLGRALRRFSPTSIQTRGRRP